MKNFNTHTIWKNSDPRLDIYKRAEIIIIKPGINGKEIGFGSVETKNSYDIFTNFENYKLISADDNWDDSWIWTRIPEGY